MKRREFLQQVSGGAVLLSSLPLLSMKRLPLRFGIVTDLHYAQKDVAINRYYRQSIEKLHDAVEVFNRSHLDFVIELGDLKDTNSSHDSTATLRFLDEVEAALQRFKGKVFHVLGNHDMDCISKADFLSHTTNPGKANGQSYYSFRPKRKGPKCIILDGNFNEDFTPYDKGNFHWTKAFIPPEELDWLSKELKEGDEPVIVFCHQLLDSFSGVNSSVCIGNAAQVVDILEESGRVLAVFQGHHHTGHYSRRNGIHYWTMKGLIEGEYPAHNSYAIAEVDKLGQILIQGYCDCKSMTLDL
ncbi:MAG: metallophosphoesterase [Bacteroidaceae bacterium]|nr:metallophosphoesterase [Bacteroidaceae bacterium]